MTPEPSSKALVICGVVALAVMLPSRVTVAWLFGDPPADVRPLAAVVDYIICGMAFVTLALTGWWAGTSAQTTVSRWIDRRFADVLRSWRDTPRSRAHDLVFVNAVAVFVLRIGNNAVGPAWRRAIGLSTAVLLVLCTWSIVDAVTPPHLPAAASAVAAVLHGLGLRLTQIGSTAAFIGLPRPVRRGAASGGEVRARLPAAAESARHLTDTGIRDPGRDRMASRLPAAPASAQGDPLKGGSAVCRVFEKVPSTTSGLRTVREMVALAQSDLYRTILKTLMAGDDPMRSSDSSGTDHGDGCGVTRAAARRRSASPPAPCRLRQAIPDSTWQPSLRSRSPQTPAQSRPRRPRSRSGTWTPG